MLHSEEHHQSLSTVSPNQERVSMNQFSQLVSTPVGAFVVLAIAAYLEVQGDACFQSRLYHSSGAKQVR